MNISWRKSHKKKVGPPEERVGRDVQDHKNRGAAAQCDDETLPLQRGISVKLGMFRGVC